jgi:hypothetical protein
LLQRVGDLDRLTAESRLLGHDQDLEARPRLQLVHQSQAAGPGDELRARDPVVDENRVVIDGPPTSLRVGAGVGDLARDRLLFVVDVALLGGLAGVNLYVLAL